MQAFVLQRSMVLEVAQQRYASLYIIMHLMLALYREIGDKLGSLGVRIAGRGMVST